MHNICDWLTKKLRSLLKLKKCNYSEPFSQSVTIIKDESFVKLQIKQSNAYNQKDFVSKIRLDSEFKSSHK